MTGERKYDVILLDVDGTLLNFDQAEADGMRVVLREYGFEPTDELLEAYHQVNNAYWAAFERGEVTKERLVCQRFETFFGSLGKTVDGAQVESLYRRSGSVCERHFRVRGRGEPEAPEGVFRLLLFKDSRRGPLPYAAGGGLAALRHTGGKCGRHRYLLV